MNRKKGKNRGLGWARLCALVLTCHCCIASDYQWSVPLDGKDKDARAFLWIPPTCQQVRGVVWGNQVILEDLFCKHPKIRAACTKENLAIILVFRGPLTQFNYKESVGSFAQWQKILDNLADVSGYSEIAKAPLLTVGHSGGAIGAWNLAYCKPQRCFGILTLHAAAMVNPPEYDPKSRVDGIPVLAVSGEYESWNGKEIPLDKHWRWLRGDLLDLRGKYEHSLVSEVVQPGAGHFNFDEKLATVCALFVQKAAHVRIPSQTAITDSVILKTIDESNGWLTDIRPLSKDRFRPTAVNAFKGDPSLAFWHIDEEMAKAVDALADQYGGRKEQRVCFVQNGGPVPAGWINELAFQPGTDGISFGLKAGFLSQTPEGPAGAGQPLRHGNEDNLRFSLIGGWGGGGEQFAPDSFRIAFSHLGTSRHCANLQVMAYQEGDAQYKYAEQAGQIKFPEKNKEGGPNTITFPDLPALASPQKSIALIATASSGLPVYYYVREGAANIKGNRLELESIPPRTQMPMKITIVAWQWGRSIEPKVQTAVPVEKVVYVR